MLWFWYNKCYQICERMVFTSIEPKDTMVFLCHMGAHYHVLIMIKLHSYNL